ncbi:unnamed protein product [Plutella xylostella]|uniref:(diamondback moth) hypothetical protein n=1 Tax=Plutella xylostella TaxID=51655 RepID=A0A8S4E8L0_PLUXY|nr:unnamed protein product [Plutella xylostella]
MFGPNSNMKKPEQEPETYDVYEEEKPIKDGSIFSDRISLPSDQAEPPSSLSSADSFPQSTSSTMSIPVHEENFTTPSNFKTHAMFYGENDPVPDLEQNVADLINSLFWVVESKDWKGLDMESRNNKKRCMGRVTKSLGDLSLQAGLAADSLALYHAAADTLRAVNDWLWLAAAKEGGFITRGNNKKRRMGRVTVSLGDLSLQAGLAADSLALYHAAADTLRAVNDWLWLAAAKEGGFITRSNNKKRCMGRVTKSLGDLSLQAGLAADSLALYHAAADTLRAVNDWLWLAAAKEAPGCNLLTMPIRTRPYRHGATTRCMGRVTKSLGDLSLQAGLAADSLALYHAAADTLRAVNDWLWLAAANEGLCAASAILLYPNLRNPTTFQRNASLQENSPNKTKLSLFQPPTDPFRRYKGISSPLRSSKTSSPTNPPTELTPSSSESVETSSRLSETDNADTESLASSSDVDYPSHKSFLPDLPSIPRQPPSHVTNQYLLNGEEIAEKYRKAIIHYSKYQNAGIIETEACFKAARIAVEQNNSLHASSFLQNVIFINLTLSEQEKIQRFDTLAELYKEIGFLRKAAFCQRLAATRQVSPNNPNPDWQRCYYLMLHSFPGHRLSLDPNYVIQHQVGWPALQIQLLQELVVAARRMGHGALATRHMTFLLHAMWPHLARAEQRDLAIQLQVFGLELAAARRMGHGALATRHMTFLLHAMWPHLARAEQRDLAIQLQVLVVPLRHTRWRYSGLELAAARRMGHGARATRHMTFLLHAMWPHLARAEQRDLAIQMQVFGLELAAARHMGHGALATCHMTFLLHAMWPHLARAEQRDLAIQLQSSTVLHTRWRCKRSFTVKSNGCYYLMLHSFPGHRLSLDPNYVISHVSTCRSPRRGMPGYAAIQHQALSAQCEGGPVPLVLETGEVIPPANLTHIPSCSTFGPRPLPPARSPHSIKLKTQQGPFIFTPIHFPSLQRGEKKNEGIMEYLWVEDDICEVQLKLTNPLPFELKVSNMRLLTSGVVFESIPETIILPPDSPTTVNLHGTPKEVGELQILGYSTHTLGVKSNCRLKNMPTPNKFPASYTIEVIPALPTITIETTVAPSGNQNLPNTENVGSITNISLHNGESTECTMKITNTSQVPIEYLDLAIQSNVDSQLQSKIFQWCNEDIQAQLPIQPNEVATITMNLYGEADFLDLGGVGETLFPNSLTSNYPSRVGSPVPNAQTSLPNTQSSNAHTSLSSGFAHNRPLTSSFRSTNSHTTSWSAPISVMPPSRGRQIETQVIIRYSGGKGREVHCRQSTLQINLELLPSVSITHWDVLPAEV